MRRTSAREAVKPNGAWIAASRDQRTMGRLSAALTSRAASASAFMAALSALNTQAATENRKISGTRERKMVEPKSALVVASRGSTQDGQASALLDHVATPTTAGRSSARGMDMRFTGTP